MKIFQILRGRAGEGHLISLKITPFMDKFKAVLSEEIEEVVAKAILDFGERNFSIETFLDHLGRLKNSDKEFVGTIIAKLSVTLYLQNLKHIQSATDILLESASKRSDGSGEEKEKLKALLDDSLKLLVVIYFLLNDKDFSSILQSLLDSKNKLFDNKEREIISKFIPFALNILILTGKLGNSDLSQLKLSIEIPFQEINFLTQEIPNHHGIKSVNRFYRIKEAKKIKDSEFPDSTVIAIDKTKNKLVYIRKINPKFPHNPDGVFASKVATLISKKNFSSEKLLTSGEVVATALPGYVHPITSKLNTDLIAGTGTIYKVCKIVNEGDTNIENLGLSANKEYLTKIDWDRVTFNKPTHRSKNKLVKFMFRELYGKEKFGIFKNSSQFLEENLIVSLKFVLLTDGLLNVYADKSYQNKHQKKTALDHFQKEMAEEFEDLKDTFGKLSQEMQLAIIEKISELHEEINAHLEKHTKHLSPEECALLKESLLERSRFIYKELSSLLKSDEEDKLLTESLKPINL